MKYFYNLKINESFQCYLTLRKSKGARCDPATIKIIMSRLSVLRDELKLECLQDAIIANRTDLKIASYAKRNGDVGRRTKNFEPPENEAVKDSPTRWISNKKTSDEMRHYLLSNGISTYDYERMEPINRILDDFATDGDRVQWLIKKAAEINDDYWRKPKN